MGPPNLEQLESQSIAAAADEFSDEQIASQTTEDALYDANNRRMTNQGQVGGNGEGQNDMVIKSDSSLLDGHSPQGNVDVNMQQNAPNLQMNASDNDVLSDDFIADAEPDGAQVTKGV